MEKTKKGNQFSTPKEQTEKLTFTQVYNLLPSPLQTQVLKRFATGILAAFITILMLCLFADWTYCFGFLISLLAIYLGLDIIWKFAEGKIYVARMVVCKAQKSFTKKNLRHVILRRADIDDLITQDIDTFQFDIATTNKNRDMITEGTLLDIYISESAPQSIIAYEILGTVG